MIFGGKTVFDTSLVVVISLKSYLNIKLNVVPFANDLTFRPEQLQCYLEKAQIVNQKFCHILGRGSNRGALTSNWLF